MVIHYNLKIKELYIDIQQIELFFCFFFFGKYTTVGQRNLPIFYINCNKTMGKLR